MKKILYLLLLLIVLYGFGEFCYKLAELDTREGTLRKEISLITNGTSSPIDLQVRQTINQKIVGPVWPDSKLYNFKIFGEQLHLYFAKTEEENQRLKVAYLNRRLAEAQVMLENGSTGLGQRMVNEFAHGTAELVNELKKQDFLRREPEKATAVELAIASQIDLQKSLMITIGSSSPLFPIKLRLLALELELADTPEEKMAVQAEQAKERQVRAVSASRLQKIVRPTDWEIAKNEISQLINEKTQSLESSGLWLTAVSMKIWSKSLSFF